MFIVYVTTKSNPTMAEVAREDRAALGTTYEQAMAVARKHAANYRSCVTVKVTTVERGYVHAECNGCKGW